jgi:hypothetical protein
MIEIRLPNINAQTSAEQLMQVKSYLYQLAEQLNVALKDVESGTASGGYSASSQVASRGSGNGPSVSSPQKTFNDIKGLIIKSADIVNAFYDEINARLEGLYVAESDFGTFVEQSALDIKANADNITTLFENERTIASDLDNINNALNINNGEVKIISTEAWVKVGALESEDSGHYLYGMEIGQTNEEDGVPIETKFARYTSKGVFLYDGGGSDTPVASITQGKLVITNAEISGYLILGAYKIDTSNGLAFKYVGRGES